MPIILASLADGSVFYIAAFIAFLNMGQWTYGVWLLTNTDEKGMLLKKDERAARKAAKKAEEAAASGASGKAGNKVGAFLLKLIKAPFMVAIIVGVFFFLTGIPMPTIASKCITFIANVNTPLAMFTVGIYMAQTDIARMFLKGRLYLVSAVRMVIIPIITILILCLIPNTMMDMKMAILIASACPVGSNVAVYAQLHDKDYPYAVETVVISTIFSIITMPVMVAIAGLIW